MLAFTFLYGLVRGSVYIPLLIVFKSLCERIYSYETRTYYSEVSFLYLREEKKVIYAGSSSFECYTTHTSTAYADTISKYQCLFKKFLVDRWNFIYFFSSFPCYSGSVMFEIIRWKFWINLCAIVVIIEGTLPEQRFAIEPQDQTAIVGSRVTLPCRVINKLGLLQWTRDDFALGTQRSMTGFLRYTMIGSDEEGAYEYMCLSSVNRMSIFVLVTLQLCNSLKGRAHSFIFLVFFGRLHSAAAIYGQENPVVTETTKCLLLIYRCFLFQHFHGSKIIIRFFLIKQCAICRVHIRHVIWNNVMSMA